MATFTAAQITDLADILGTNSDVLSLHLDFYAGIITDSDKTKVLARVTSYQALDDLHANFSPKESNEGLKLSASGQRNYYARKIANLLQFPFDSGGNVMRV